MLAGTMNTTQKIPFDFAPDQPLDGHLNATVVSGDATIEETSPDGLHGFIVSGETAGDEAHVEWEGDADPTSGFSSIKETAIITITAPMATSLGGTIGAPVPKGDATTPPPPEGNWNDPRPDHSLPGDPKPDNALPGQQKRRK
jgi:hypothetical protein